jgi:hypothetical protein
MAVSYVITPKGNPGNPEAPKKCLQHSSMKRQNKKAAGFSKMPEQ